MNLGSLLKIKWMIRRPSDYERAAADHQITTPPAATRRQRLAEHPSGVELIQFHDCPRPSAAMRPGLWRPATAGSPAPQMSSTSRSRSPLSRASRVAAKAAGAPPSSPAPTPAPARLAARCRRRHIMGAAVSGNPRSQATDRPPQLRRFALARQPRQQQFAEFEPCAPPATVPARPPTAPCLQCRLAFPGRFAGQRTQPGQQILTQPRLRRRIQPAGDPPPQGPPFRPVLGVLRVLHALLIQRPQLPDPPLVQRIAETRPQAITRPG
jgi:hypothetical protein